MNQKLRVGIIGATGMVGQRFVLLLADHPWFTITSLAASSRSAGQTYEKAVDGRWAMDVAIPQSVRNMPVADAMDVAGVAAQVDLVFCAVDMPKPDTRALEEAYAKAEIPVISNNSACRNLADVPMMVPEINPEHAAVIQAQRARLGTRRGFIAVKPNCSIQSYVPALHPLRHFGISQVFVSTYQAISGAGKTFDSWPEMIDNVIPYIGGEEEKSEQEPLKLWGGVQDGAIVNATAPVISAQCIRVPVTNGHLATVTVKFDKKPSIEEMKAAWLAFEGEPQKLNLPSAPKPFLKYFEEDNRPQTLLDRDFERGMGVTVGRLRPDSLLDYRFVCLSHNTLRGAAGGAVLTAELLVAKKYI